MSTPALDRVLAAAAERARSPALRRWLRRLLQEGEHAEMPARRRTPPPDMHGKATCRVDEKVAETQ